jgi:hypothetical protein
MSRSPLYSAGHVQLPIRVLLLCSPCASRHQVPCSTSRVVPRAHRVVGPGTHQGSGPREVHTTPSPSMIAFNKSFGTSYQGKLLSVGYEKADARDGTSKLLTLWNSSKIVDETGEGASKQTSPPFYRDSYQFGKEPSSSSQRVTVTLSGKGSRIVCSS